MYPWRQGHRTGHFQNRYFRMTFPPNRRKVRLVDGYRASRARLPQTAAEAKPVRLHFFLILKIPRQAIRVLHESRCRRIMAAFFPGEPAPEGYISGPMIARYRFGAGNFLLNTFNVLENIDKHPAANCLLLNPITFAGRFTTKPLAVLPKNFERVIKSIPY